MKYKSSSNNNIINRKAKFIKFLLKFFAGEHPSHPPTIRFRKTLLSTNNGKKQTKKTMYLASHTHTLISRIDNAFVKLTWPVENDT